MAAFLSSGCVALAASVSTAFLYRAGEQIHGMSSRTVPVVQAAGEVADAAGALAMTLDDFAEAQTAGNRRAMEEAEGGADGRFKKLDQAITALEGKVGSGSQGEAYVGKAEELRHRARELDTEWTIVNSLPVGKGETAEADGLDDHAMMMVGTAMGLQKQAVEGMTSRLQRADSYITWVSRLSLGMAGAMSLLTLGTGIVFATSLARRLLRIRNQARVVGSGNLDVRLDVARLDRKRDEIDEIAVSFNDMVDALKGSREKLEKDATEDVLTGLPNRKPFMERLASVVREGKRCAVYFMDVDRFKQINDTAGHAAGDEVLKEFAVRVREVSGRYGAEKRAKVTVARLSGDEFTVLLEGAVDEAEAETLGEWLREEISRPMRVGGKLLEVTSSIGVAMGSGGVTDPKEMLRRADAALYEVKRAGRNGCRVYGEKLRRATAPVGR